MGHTDDPQDFGSVYDRRRRASFEDARAEAEAVTDAINRISAGVDEGTSPAGQNLAAGKLFEIANELPSAEAAYRRVLADEPDLEEAAARLAVVLTKQRRFDEALKVANDLFLKSPDALFRSLVYEGPLSLCTVLGDAYRLSGNPTVAAALYREAAKVEGSTPYAVSQAVVTMAMAGEAADIGRFAEEHAGAALGERISSVLRLSREMDERLPIVNEIAIRADIAAAEALWVSPLDLVS